MVEMVKIVEHARALIEAHGDKAEVEAAHKAADLKKTGQHAEAEQWTRVRKAIHEMRTGHVS